MNQKQAFADTITLAELADMPELPGSSLGLEHLRDMYSRIEPEFSESKLGRWLGWAQCALVASGVGINLEDVKNLNSKYADE
jgi:hypothetical protein